MTPETALTDERLAEMIEQTKCLSTPGVANYHTALLELRILRAKVKSQEEEIAHRREVAVSEPMTDNAARCPDKKFHIDRMIRCELPTGHEGPHCADWPPRGEFAYGLEGRERFFWRSPDAADRRGAQG